MAIANISTMKIAVGIIIFLILYIYLKFPYPKSIDPTKTYDVALVLGCPSNPDGTISPIQKKRMDKAIACYHTGIVKKIIVSGSNAHNEFFEAKTMAFYALSQKVKNSDILLELQARNTYENLKYAKTIIEKAHFQSLVVITSPFHMRRANFFVHKFFINYVMATYHERPTWKERIEEYFRMWNTLYYEEKLKHQRK